MKTTASLLAILGFAATAFSAQTALYEETFTGPGNPTTLSAVGWTAITPTVGYSGTFAYAITNSANGQPINGQHPVYLGAGSATGVVGTGMFYTTNGAGTGPSGTVGFGGVNPAAFPTLTFSIYANLQGSGAGELGYFAVQVGGAWYSSITPMARPTSSNFAYDLRTLNYAPAAANWNTLVVNATSVTISGPVSANLTGPITGVGIVETFNNPANNFDAWNFADFSIVGVPEPTTIPLLCGGAVAAIVLRRRRSSR